MKLLFVNIPLGANYSLTCQPVITILASHINKSGRHTAAICDLSFTPAGRDRHFLDAIRKFRPDILGFNSESILGFDEFEATLTALCGLSGLPAVAGGFHVTLDPLLYQEIDALDYIVSGDGEQALCGLLDCLEHHVPADSIKGLWMRGKHPAGLIRQGSFCRENRDIFPLDWDLWDSLDRNFYFTGKLSYVGTRGCKGNCVFCSNNEIKKAADGDFYRTCDPITYADELVECFRKYKRRGLRLLRLHDPDITGDHEWCRIFCGRIIEKKPVHFMFQAFSNINTLNDEMARLLSRAGCVRLCTGIECGSQEIRTRMYNKNIHPSTIRRYMELTSRYGISVMAFYIFGGPGENVYSLASTLDMIIRLKTAQYGLAKFVPFTKASRELLARYSTVEPSAHQKKLKNISFSNFIPFSFSSFSQKQLPTFTVELFQLAATIIVLWRQWINIIREMKILYLTEMFSYFRKGFSCGLSLIPLLINYHIKYCDYRILEMKRPAK